MHLKKQSLTLYVLFFFARSADAQAEQEGLLGLSLDDLLSVSIMSQQVEPIALSPGLVSSLDIRTLERQGLHTLADIISFLPGVEVNKTLTGNTIIQIRGLHDSFNQKLLFMVDGIPYWMPASGDIPLLGIPSSSIETVEVIRGPGSFIYGTNASSAVINVVTKTAHDSNLVDISLDETGHYTSNIFVSAALPFDGSISLAAETQNADSYQASVKNAFSAFDPNCLCFPSNADGSALLSDESDSILLSAQLGGFKTSLQWHNTKSIGTSDGTLLSHRTGIEEGKLFALSYQKIISDFDIKLFSQWNNYYVNSDITDINLVFGIPGDGEIVFDNEGKSNTRWRSGLNIQKAIYKQLKLDISVDYEERSTENQLYQRDDGNEILESFGVAVREDGTIHLIEKDEASEFGGNLQLDYRNTYWTFVGGARYSSNDEAGTNLSPRISIIYKANNKHAFKALYSEGYASPTFRQSSAVNQLGQRILSDIHPETVRSSDLVWTYTNNQFQIISNAFQIKLTNGISHLHGEFKNSEEIKREGLELEIKRHEKNWNYYASTSFLYQGNEQKTNDNNAFFNSKFTSKLGGSYQFKTHSLGGSLRTATERANTAPYYWLNANYQYQHKNYTLSFSIENLLDSTIYFPDVRSSNTLQTQATAGRTSQIGLRIAF